MSSGTLGDVQYLSPADFVDDAAALLEQSAAEHEMEGRTASAKHQRRAAARLRTGGMPPT